VKGLLFTYLLTYGGSAAAVFKPFYGLLIYICFACIRPELLWTWSVPAGHYSRTIAVCMLIGWIRKGCGSWNFLLAWPIVVTFLTYWGWIVVSAFFAANQAVAWSFVDLHSKILFPVLVGITIIERPSELRILAWVLALSLGYLALEANLDYFAGGTMARDQGMGGMDNNCFSISMALGAGLSFFLGVAEKRWQAKLAAWGAAALMVHVPMISNSRGGMLSLVVLGVASFFLLPKRPMSLAAYGLGIVMALQFAGANVWQRFQTVFADSEGRDASAQSRLDLWRHGWDVMKKHPLTGAGPDHWPLLAASYGWRPGKEMHSLWVNAGAELGFVGLGALVMLYFLTISMSAQFVWKHSTSDTWQVHAARMSIAGLLGFSVAASFVSLDALEPPYHLVLLAAASLKLGSSSIGTVEVLSDREFDVGAAIAA
jgi:putative inorganic carbon (HCO3(-)) transporter